MPIRTSMRAMVLGTASVAALTLAMSAAPVLAQDAAPAAAADTGTTEIVVVGIKKSLQRAADIKRRSDNVVESIVSDDIGKFPDNTVAAALQRVPGVQVVNGFNNEIINPIIRGIGDIETTLDGREVFTGVGRGFAFQDLPAESLAGADIYKSNSADLVEGGVAGVINLKRQKPFNFKKGLTVAGSLRGSYGEQVDKGSYTYGLLVSDRWDTSVGEMGLLGSVSYADQHFNRPISFNCDPRSANHGPSGAANIVLPTCVGGLTDTGDYQRPQASLVYQWRVNDNLEVYADGLYAGYRAKFATYFIFSDIFAAQNITNATAGTGDDCFSAHVDGAGFHNSGGTLENLCLGTKATFNNVPGLTSTQAKTGETDQYIFGGGLKYHHEAFAFNLDLSSIRSANGNRNTIVDIGKQISAVNILVNDDSHGTTDMPGNPLGSKDDFRFANGLFQDYNKSRSTMSQIRGDGTWNHEGFLRQLQFGFRFADRKAQFYSNAPGGPGAPGGNRVTLVNSVGLPADFLILSPNSIPVINGGAHWYTPDPDFLRDHTDTLRALYGQAAGDPAWDPSRNFNAQESTGAAYIQVKYGFDIGNMPVDGLVGGRFTTTDRSLTGTGRVNGVLTPVTRDTKDSDFLPNASLRIQLTDKLQARLTYAKTIARPFFGDLNPGVTYDIPLNANIQPNGSGGNPDLRPQKSDAYDATLEYYFTRTSYLAAAVYKRDIVDRVAPSVEKEVINGITYNMTRPRNVAASQLQGFELSGQYFFDFLPGVFNGLGVLANYTRADSKINTPGDALYGTPLLGVSKDSYNIGGIYEKYGISARVVYNWRSGYNEFLADFLVPGADTNQRFNRVKSNGRLDFSVSYDVNEHITVSLDGVNINGGQYHSYFDTPSFPHDIRIDDKFLGFSIRAKY